MQLPAMLRGGVPSAVMAAVLVTWVVLVVTFTVCRAIAGFAYRTISGA